MPNRFEFRANWRLFCQTLLFDYDFHVDPALVAFEHAADSLTDDIHTTRGKQLVLELSQAKYRELSDGYASLERKGEELLKVSVTLLILTASIYAVVRHSPWWIQLLLSFAWGLLMISTSIFALARRVSQHPGLPAPHALRLHLRQTFAPEDTVAGSISKTCEAIKIVTDIKAAHLNFALDWMFLGLLFLLIALTVAAWHGAIGAPPAIR